MTHVDPDEGAQHAPDEDGGTSLQGPATPRGRRGLRAFAIGCGLLLLLLMAGVLVFIFFETPVPQRPFDSNVWKQVDGRVSNDSRRQAMLRDVRRNHLTPGLTRAEVLDLLGAPSSEGGHVSEYWFEYFLGPSRKLLDYLEWEWLIVRFDGSSGRLIEVQVYRP